MGVDDSVSESTYGGNVENVGVADEDGIIGKGGRAKEVNVILKTFVGRTPIRGRSNTMSAGMDVESVAKTTRGLIWSA